MFTILTFLTFLYKYLPILIRILIVCIELIIVAAAKLRKADLKMNLIESNYFTQLLIVVFV